MTQPPLESLETIPSFKIYHNSEEDFSEHEAAGFNLRFLALVIDALILRMIQKAFAFLLQGLYLHLGSASLGLMIAAMAVVYLAQVTYYFVWPLAEWGQTFGKMMMGIKVVGLPGTPQALSFPRAFQRELLGKPFSLFLMGAGFLQVAFRKDRLALHDNLSKTRVVKL